MRADDLRLQPETKRISVAPKAVAIQPCNGAVTVSPKYCVGESSDQLRTKRSGGGSPGQLKVKLWTELFGAARNRDHLPAYASRAVRCGRDSVGVTGSVTGRACAAGRLPTLGRSAARIGESRVSGTASVRSL